MGKITDLLKKIQAEREESKKNERSPMEKVKEVLNNQIQPSDTMRAMNEKKSIIGQYMHTAAAGNTARKDAFVLDSSLVVEPAHSGISEKIITYHEYNSQISEQYRILRTHIKSILNHKSNGNRKVYDKRVLSGSPHIMTITSSLVGEGKTLTCSNVAVALAHDLESKVLLIDCDLRKGSVAEYFKIDPKPGLTEVLQGNCHYSEAVHKTGIPNLFILPHGKVPQHPSELLGSKAMQKMLEELRTENLNYIILDTPPLMPFTDATLLAAQTDAVFLVVQAHRTRTPIVRKAQELLQQANSRLSGCILNQTEYYIPDVYGSYYYYMHNRYYGKGNGNGNGNGTHSTTTQVIETNEKTKEGNSETDVS